MKEKYKTVQHLFEVYDEASNKATDCLISAIEARMKGKTAIAEFLENRVYPKLSENSYKLFCQFDDAVKQL